MRNVLSLFDGISCGRVALDRAKIKYKTYYASEVDKYVIAIARYNYPDTVFIGDIRNLKGKDFKDVDLIIGGSPCQNFSFSGKRNGMTTKENIEITTLEQYLELKEQGFKFEGQSYLFWEYVRLLKEIKPKWFLLENVKMARKWQDVITKALEVEPIEINSSLVSAQNRRRLYWTNIPVKGLPEDRGILLKDILEKQVDEKYFINKRLKNIKGKLAKKKALSNLRTIEEKAKCLTAAGQNITNSSATNVCYVDRDKSYCIDACYYKGGNLKQYLEKKRRQLVFELDNNLNLKVRKLTPLECERLQTLPDYYTKYGLFEDGKVRQISDTQRYKAIGNGWTVDVISWIFSFIEDY
jgi:DNA (cytosine-5)-methyltransferase 3A